MKKKLCVVREGAFFLSFLLLSSLFLGCSKSSDDDEIIPEPDYAVDALKTTSNKRVDLLMIGDSNQLKDGTGFDHGFGKALGTKYGYFATALFQTADRPSLGYLCANDGTVGDNSDIPSELEFMSGYGYLKNGTFATPFNGIGIKKDCPLNVNSNLRFHYAYGTFTSGEGSFEFGVRYGEAPWSVLKKKPIVKTNTGEYKIIQDYIDIDAGVRGVNLEAKWYVPGSSEIVAPFASYYVRCEDLKKNNGISVGTIFSEGSASMYDMAYWFINQPDKYLTNYFSEIRKMQLTVQDQPIVVVSIHSGFNDMTETISPSLGNGKVKDPKSADAYVDNLDALISRISAVWSKAGWNLGELYFWVIPSHPISNPDNSKLVSYRKAAYKYCAVRSHVGYFDISEYITSDEIYAKGYYLGDETDRYHLTQAGYEYISQLIVDKYLQ